MAKIFHLTTAGVFVRPLRALVTCALVLAMMAIILPGSALAAKSKGNPKYSSIVVDAESGEILSEAYADKKLHPASLTKIMTLLMLFEAIETGKTDLNKRIVISKHAAGMAPSKLGLAPGSSIKVKDAIYALVTKSANDIAAAVGEHVSGSESAFARDMTARAHEIGMRNTTFVNASGLHNPRQISTARDMAKLARFVILQYPEYYRYFSTVNFKYQGKNYHNHNRLMESYKGMDGMKTGYTNPSGFNLVASAVRNDRRLIGVVFGGRTTKSRNAHMASLLDRGFASRADMRVARADNTKRLSPVPAEAVLARTAAPLPLKKPATPMMMLAEMEQQPAPARVAALLQPDTLKPSDVSAKPLLVADTDQADAPGTRDLEPGFDELIGQGDFDPAVYKRIEAGLSAIAAHKGAEPKPAEIHRVLTAAQNMADAKDAPVKTAKVVPASYTAPAKQPAAAPGWSVQIGAFASRAATDQAIQNVLKQVPAPYSQAQPMIAPLKTAKGWLFRGRLTGFTRTEALAACNYIKDCLPVAPSN